jgi:hypothetical protein
VSAGFAQPFFETGWVWPSHEHTHCHRYCGVQPRGKGCEADADTRGAAAVLVGSGGAVQSGPPVKPKPGPPSHCLWAALIAPLIARICWVIQLICPMCGGQTAHRCFHCIQRKSLQNTGTHRSRTGSCAHRPGTRATAVGRLCCAGDGAGVGAEPDGNPANQSPPNCPDDQYTLGEFAELVNGGDSPAGAGLRPSTALRAVRGVAAKTHEKKDCHFRCNPFF